MSGQRWMSMLPHRYPPPGRCDGVVPHPPQPAQHGACRAPARCSGDQRHCFTLSRLGRPAWTSPVERRCSTWDCTFPSQAPTLVPRRLRCGDSCRFPEEHLLISAPAASSWALPCPRSLASAPPGLPLGRSQSYGRSAEFLRQRPLELRDQATSALALPSVAGRELSPSLALCLPSLGKPCDF